MKRTLALLLLLSPSALAQAPAGGGGFSLPPGECLDDAARAAIRARLQANVARLRDEGVLPVPGAALGVDLAWPVQGVAGLTGPGVHGISNFVDQDATFPSHVLDYDCGTRSYDTSGGYNHQGVDVFTWPFAWLRMDTAAVQIVAAAPGVIIGKDDGNPDRSCSTSGGNWNAVYVQHADGSVAWYGHMKNGSPTGKAVGTSVAQGEYLGVVGSSGNSTGPHLHLELYDGASNLTEAYSGACNAMASSSSWAAQRPYYDSALNEIATHSAAPVFPSCPTAETPHYQDAFSPGATAYFAAYYRDQLQGQVSTYSILRPDLTTWQTWTASSAVAHYAASYWYWTWTLPASPQGTWRYRVSYQGQVLEHEFTVGTPSPALSISDPAARGEGSANVTFAVTLSAPSASTVSVGYATANGTATASLDYTAKSGTLTFAPGTTVRNLGVALLDDTLDEVTETFTVTLSTPANATLADGGGKGRIADDDPLPLLAISNRTLAEGDSGTANARFTVSLSPASGWTVKVTYDTAPVTATEGVDYVGKTATLTFLPGQTAKTPAVLVKGDVIDEGAETFVVDLSGATNAGYADAQGQVTISDDDP